MTTTIREAIRERLDPIIEEIVAKEIGERGASSQERGGSERERSMEALASMLMMNMMGQRREKEQEKPMEEMMDMMMNMMSRRGEKEQEKESPMMAMKPMTI